GELVDSAAIRGLAVVAERRRWLAMVPKDVILLLGGTRSALSRRILRRVPSVRGLDQAATHTGHTTTHRVGDINHAVRLGVESRLVLQSEDDRVTELRLRRRRHNIDTAVARQADELLADRHQRRQHAAARHRLQRAVHIVHLRLGSSDKLNQRRRPRLPPRVARLVRPLPAAPAAMIRAAIHVAGLGPTIEQHRADSLGSRDGRRPRTLARLLRRDDLRTAILEGRSARNERLLAILIDVWLASRASVRLHPIVIASTPKLPIVHPERLALAKAVRDA